MSLQAVGQHAAAMAGRAAWTDRSDDLMASLSAEPSFASSAPQQLQAMQRLAWRGAQVLARVPWSLALYWRALQMILSDVFVLPRHGAASRLLWSVDAPSAWSTSLTSEAYADAVLSSLVLMRQLVGGGSELSQVPSPALLLRKESKKRKAKKKIKSASGLEEEDGAREGGTGLCAIDPCILRNMRLKLEALCEVGA